MEGGPPAAWNGPIRPSWQPNMLAHEHTGGQSGWTGPYNAEYNMQGVAGVPFSHPHAYPSGPFVHHQHRPPLLQATPSGWVFRPVTAAPYPSPLPSVSALHFLVTKIEEEHPKGVQEQLGSHEVKERAQLAATKLNQLKEISKSLASEDGTEEGLRCVQAEVIDLKASITKLLEPLDRLRRGEGTPAEFAAWNDYANRHRKINQYRARRKKQRRRVAKTLREGREAFASVNAAADEWRAQRLAEDIAKKRFLEMEKAASVEARKIRRQLEQDIDALLLLERLQKLRMLRVARLRKQGHMFPEEDGDFMARVQQSVEQEAAAARAVPGSPSSVATPAHPPSNLESNGEPGQKAAPEGCRNQDQMQEESADTHGDMRTEAELQHYYNGSATNMGRLIEVRRAWDTFLSADGSAIPGHWVVPPASSDPLWARYLQTPEG